MNWCSFLGHRREYRRVDQIGQTTTHLTIHVVLECTRCPEEWVYEETLKLKGDDPPPPPEEPPPYEDPIDLAQIDVPHPGTPEVFAWPEVMDLDIQLRIVGGNIIFEWPRVTWPAFDIHPDTGEAVFGHSGMVYRSGGQWYAIATEWLRDALERYGSWHPYEDKFIMGPPDAGVPIAFFIAGPWRHQPNKKKYRRRTRLKWFMGPNLDPYTWPTDDE